MKHKFTYDAYLGLCKLSVFYQKIHMKYKIHVDFLQNGQLDDIHSTHIYSTKIEKLSLCDLKFLKQHLTKILLHSSNLQFAT